MRCPSFFRFAAGPPLTVNSTQCCQFFRRRPTPGNFSLSTRAVAHCRGVRKAFWYCWQDSDFFLLSIMTSEDLPPGWCAIPISTRQATIRRSLLKPLKALPTRACGFSRWPRCFTPESRLIEACGLWYRRTWAEIFAIVTGAIYLPIEVYEIVGTGHRGKNHGPCRERSRLSRC